MVREILINASEMEAPQPFEEVLKRLKTLQPDQYIHMLHRKQPLPLVQLLEQNGYVVSMREGQTIPWEIFIWRKSDPLANQYCQTHFKVDS